LHAYENVVIDPENTSPSVTYTPDMDLTEEGDKIGKALTVTIVDSDADVVKSNKDWETVYNKYKTNLRQENEMRHLNLQPSTFQGYHQNAIPPLVYRSHCCVVPCDLVLVLADKLRRDDSTGYPALERSFHTRKTLSLETNKRGAVIVDLFGGIGAGIVCLKRLGIKIDRIIHVEHYQVANVVYKHAHCQPGERVDHVFLQKF
jgi:hypothetical protein